MTLRFVDIHCHILPGIDDGPSNWEDALAMARLAAEQRTTTVIATPHQLGSFGHNRGADISPLVDELNGRLDDAGIPLQVLPGGELRIEASMIAATARGEALTLGAYRRHVLIELPHDLYLPIDSLLADFARRKITAILAHPERNGGLLRQPALVAQLIDAGCLMQVTASSFTGSFGSACQELAEAMLRQGQVHFIATDGHGPRSRRPLMRRAFERVAQLCSEQTAIDLCCRNPARVANNLPVPAERTERKPPRRGWFQRRNAG